MRISNHFQREEFACNCGCGQDTIDYALVRLLEAVRKFFNAPVSVTSGNRCNAYNAKIGGSLGSQHRLGRAADIRVAGVEPEAVADYLETAHNPPGLGRYKTFTHVDTRSGPRARWGEN